MSFCVPGILTNPRQIAMTGPDFRSMTEAEKAETIPRLRVLARSSPLDKEILVRWLKSEGHVVAVTGDGTKYGCRTSSGYLLVLDPTCDWRWNQVWM